MPSNLPAGAREAFDLIRAGLDALEASMARAEAPKAVHMVGLKEAARRLGMHWKTVSRRAGSLGGVKADGAWPFDPEKLPTG